MHELQELVLVYLCAAVAVTGSAGGGGDSSAMLRRLVSRAYCLAHGRVAVLDGVAAAVDNVVTIHREPRRTQRGKGLILSSDLL